MVANSSCPCQNQLVRSIVVLASRCQMPDLLYLEWEYAVDGYAVESLTTEADMGRFGVAGSDSNFLLQMGSRVEPLFIVPLGKAMKRYRPLSQHPALFRQFADLDETPKDAVAFTGEFGPLGVTTYLKHGPDLTSMRDVTIEPFFLWRGHVQEMKQWINIWEEAKAAGDLAPIIKEINAFEGVEMRARLARGADSAQAVFHLEPPTLFHALRLQFVQAVTGNAQLRKCMICPTWFVFGAGTGRRKSGDYCSDRCRKAHWRQQQKEKNQ